MLAEKKFDTDDPEHIGWVYRVAAARAAEFKIEGVTWSLTQGVVKNIIPAIASTNAVIAGKSKYIFDFSYIYCRPLSPAACCNEAFKIATSSAAYLNNYFMLIGTEGVYSYTFEHEKRKDCPVCGGEAADMTLKLSTTVEQLIDILVEKQDMYVSYFSFVSCCDQLETSQIKKPSLSTGAKHIYFQAPPQLEQATRPNLEKKVSELVPDGGDITVTATTLPFNLTLRINYAWE